MQKILLTLFALFITISTAHAQSMIEEDYYSGEPLASTPWYETGYNEVSRTADMKFITDMRPHHAGALSMVDDYEVSGKGTSARLIALTNGIRHNQTFEISMLDMVEAYIKDACFCSGAPVKVADMGLAQNKKFVRLPMPIKQAWLAPADQVSAEDVRFAKAMIIHHEGALVMARDYLNDPNATNGYLQRMCLDILRDQTQEIALMHDIIAHYPGDADAIKIDPSMVHGMDGMMHSGRMNTDKKGHGGHHGMHH